MRRTSGAHGGCLSAFPNCGILRAFSHFFIRTLKIEMESEEAIPSQNLLKMVRMWNGNFRH